MRNRPFYRHLACGLTCTAIAVAQVRLHGSDTANEPVKKQREQVSAHVMIFMLDSLVKDVKASPALEVPFQCSQNGVVLVHMVDPVGNDSQGASMYLEISGDHGIRLDTSSVKDIDVVAINSYAFAGSEAVLALYGRRRSDSGAEKNPLRHFLAFFSATGQFDKLVELKGEQVVGIVGVLPTGDFVVSGHDIGNRQDTLSIYNEAGVLDRPLDQPVTAKERATGYQQGNPTSFVNHGDNVVVYRKGTRDAVLEIGQKNTVREVALALPPGIVISNMVSSDDSFIVQGDERHDPGAMDFAQSVYYEFDTLDGSLIRTLTSGNPLVNNIACKVNGRFTSFVTNRDHQFMKMDAN